MAKLMISVFSYSLISRHNDPPKGTLTTDLTAICRPLLLKFSKQLTASGA